VEERGRGGVKQLEMMRTHPQAMIVHLNGDMLGTEQ
jgi:hypothetical protein